MVCNTVVGNIINPVVRIQFINVADAEMSAEDIRNHIVSIESDLQISVDQ